jgi:hypothetical protein
MEIVIGIVIAGVVIWALFIRDINPSNKSDEQLRFMYEKASNQFVRNPSYSRQLEILTDEMEKRGLFDTGTHSSNTENKGSEVLEGNHNHASVLRANRDTERSDPINEAEISKRVYVKSMKLCSVKNINHEEAESLILECRNTFMQKYIDNGLDADDAAKRALLDALDNDYDDS